MNDEVKHTAMRYFVVASCLNVFVHADISRVQTDGLYLDNKSTLASEQLPAGKRSGFSLVLCISLGYEQKSDKLVLKQP